MQLSDILAQKLPLEMIAVDHGQVIERADKQWFAHLRRQLSLDNRKTKWRPCDPGSEFAESCGKK